MLICHLPTSDPAPPSRSITGASLPHPHPRLNYAVTDHKTVVIVPSLGTQRKVHFYLLVYFFFLSIDHPPNGSSGLPPSFINVPEDLFLSAVRLLSCFSPRLL